MTIYESLEAKNALSYTELSIPLDQQGLVLIDGKVGAGKSSIFDILTHILYGTTAKDGISANGILNRYVTDKSGKPCGYSGRAKFSNLGHSYVVEQYRAHPEKGTSLEFFEDGKSIKEKVNRSDNLDTQKLVAKKLGLSLREFYGGVYLPQNHTHDLVVGKEKARQEYLLRYFGIDLFDRMIPEVKERAAASAVGADTTVFDTRLAALDEEAAQYGVLANLRLNAQSNERRIATLTKELDSAEALVKLVHVQHDRWTQYEAADKKVREHACADLDVSKAQQELDTIRFQLQRLQEQQDALQKSESLIALLRVEQKLDNFDHVQRSLQDLRSVLVAYEKDSPKIAKIAELRETLVPDVEWNDTLAGKLLASSSKLVETRGSASALKAEIAKLQSLGDMCFVCLRPVSADECRSLLDERTTLLAATTKIVDQISNTVALLEEIRDTAAKNTRVQEQISALESALLGAPQDLDVVATKKTIQQLQASIDSHQRYVDLETKIAQLGGGLDVLDATEVAAMRKRWSARVALLSEYVSLVASRGDAPPCTTLGAVESAVKDAQVLRDEIQILRDELTRITYGIQILQRIETQRSKVIEERSALADKIRRHRVLQTLHLGLKDLRSIKLHNAAQLLVSVLPMYLQVMFRGEDIKVSVEDTEDSCDLVFSKNGTWIPLEGLSGGQKRALGLSLLFTFTQIANRNSNILILDEPYTNLDVPSRAACYEILKDLLGPDRKNKNLTSLFVMSHEQDLKAQRFDQRWVVEYNGSTSRLVIP